MGSKIVPKPPQTPEEMAKLIGGESPAEAQPAAIPAKEINRNKLPRGKINDPCKVKRADGSKCPGHLTDLGGFYPDKAQKVTRATLVCSKCDQVQAIAEVADPT